VTVTLTPHGSDPGEFDGTHIVFRMSEWQPSSEKTCVWDVRSKHGDHLGEVKWFGRWRKYTFFPAPGWFEEVCLREIAQFIVDRTAEHKGRKAI
jgi:hypothetical protein